MCFKFQTILVLVSTACFVTSTEIKDKRQVGSVVLQKDDHQVAESGFIGGGPAAVHAGSKYFQDMYMAQHSPEEIEFGHVCETPHDWEQRFERINFENHKRQGKVRWGDKHGGYGEHYWDYNHAGHGHDGDGEESQQNEEYTTYDETKHVPKYTSEKLIPGREKRQPSIISSSSDDVEFINDNARSLVLSGISGSKHGGNYKSERDYERGKREGEQKKQKNNRIDGKNFVFDQEAQLVVDKETGIAYELKPVDY